ncbi:MAG: phosphoglycerate mutase family protein [Candidatus Kaiserbacteria bacterium]|nr:phosphoglycerate mutase family protein [Candidatus Kaiserbacteria bacterium]
MSELPELVVAMRHAESERNKAAAAARKGDLSLHLATIQTHDHLCSITERGKRQAKSAQDWLAKKKLHFDKIIHSPIQRVPETLTEVFGSYWKGDVDHRLMERRLGSPLENMLHVDRLKLAATDSRFSASVDDAFNYSPPGGNSFATMLEETKDFFESLKNCDAHAVFLGTHSMRMRIIRMFVENQTPDQMIEHIDDFEHGFQNCEMYFMSRVSPFDDNQTFPNYQFVRRVNPYDESRTTGWRQLLY